MERKYAVKSKYVTMWIMRLAALTAVILLLPGTVFAADNSICRAYDWYCPRASDNRQPVCDSRFSFIDKYECYYIDKKASDTDKVLYLTFDAGYENGNVAKIVDALAAHKATGAFFLLDNIIIREPELIRRMAANGNLICNHTVKHHDMASITDPEAFRGELTALETVLAEQTGLTMDKFYRPPQGRFSELNLKHAQEMGYKTVLWSFAYADWDNGKQPSPEEAVKKILKNTHNGAVILLHPTSATNAAIMDRLLTEWEAQGYRFGSLYELTGQTGSGSHAG